MTNPSAEATTGTPSERKDEWSESRLRKFWEAMRNLYGRRWTQEYGDEINPLWRAELMSITPSEAALGFEQCKRSADDHPCTLPAFMYRVKSALASRRPTIPEYKPLPKPPREVSAAMSAGTKEAAEKAAKVDIPRLRKALGGKPVRASWPRRVILRGQTHPAGRFDLDDVMQLRGQARQAGRSMWDVDLELMAYNGWSPDDEENYDKALAIQPSLRTPKDKGTTPFFDAWQATEPT